ncbi:hypothetical protein [Mesorhizobium sp.]|uniref:hypothetical protein n=1 Tax=Mesorhizobium sp. TaxID=1871066 RepID=UPI003BAD5C8B
MHSCDDLTHGAATATSARARHPCCGGPEDANPATLVTPASRPGDTSLAQDRLTAPRRNDATTD